jgi:threonine/homoserine/homoserine lactone efflux protein
MQRRTVPAVAGMLTGHLGAAAVVAAGVGAVIAGVPGALTILTIAGALYLVWIGISVLRRPGVVHVGDAATRGSRWGWWAKGLGVSGLNPKVFLLFVAILPQFIDRTGHWPAAAQIGVLGLVHVAGCAVVYLVVGFGADRVLGSRPRVAAAVSRVSGIAMIAIGVVLVVERVLAR